MLLRDFFYKKILNYNIPFCVSSDDVSCVKLDIDDKKIYSIFSLNYLKQYPYNKNNYEEELKRLNSIIVKSPIFFFKNNLIDEEFYRFPNLESFRELILEAYDESIKYGRGIGGFNYIGSHSGIPYGRLFGISPRFPLKMDKKNFISNDSKEFNVGDVIDLNEMNVNKIFYTIYFKDYKTTEELKTISEYKMKQIK